MRDFGKEFMCRVEAARLEAVKRVYEQGARDSGLSEVLDVLMAALLQMIAVQKSNEKIT